MFLEACQTMVPNVEETEDASDVVGADITFEMLAGMCSSAPTTVAGATLPPSSAPCDFSAIGTRSLQDAALAKREEVVKCISKVKRIVRDSQRAAVAGFGLVEGACFPEVQALLDTEWTYICDIIKKHGFQPKSASAHWYDVRTEFLIRYRGFGDRDSHREVQREVASYVELAVTGVSLQEFAVFTMQDNT